MMFYVLFLLVAAVAALNKATWTLYWHDPATGLSGESITSYNSEVECMEKMHLFNGRNPMTGKHDNPRLRSMKSTSCIYYCHIASTPTTILPHGGFWRLEWISRITDFTGRSFNEYTREKDCLSIRDNYNRKFTDIRYICVFIPASTESIDITVDM